MAQGLAQLLAPGARARGLDLGALLAVASQEGASGGIGDGGHAFGPFQLNNAGGVITGRFPGLTPQQINRWAWSPAGINFALDRIASVARGLHGRQAVTNIVGRFERPADIPGETARALRGLGAPVNPAGPMLPGPSATPVLPGANAPGVPPPGALNPALVSLLAQNRETVGLPEINFPTPQAPSAIPRVATGQRPQPQTLATGNVTAAGASPRRSGKTIGYLEHIASPFGLTVTSTTGGRHAKNSYHYRGRAVDFGGDPARMAALAKFALAHPKQFVEVIYTGPGSTGYSILDGKVIPNTQLAPSLYRQHTNHVHLAR